MLSLRLRLDPTYVAAAAFPVRSARLAVFFPRRSAARRWRCLAWIFLRLESVILGMAVPPLSFLVRPVDFLRARYVAINEALDLRFT
jgi:hypothetical protein